MREAVKLDEATSRLERSSDGLSLRCPNRVSLKAQNLILLLTEYALFKLDDATSELASVL
jgi:hypothetical protein